MQMTPEQKERLIAICPEAFSENARQHPMIYVDAGWYGVVEAFLKKVKAHCETEPQMVEISEIKQKFGKLKIIARGCSVRVRDMIDHAELTALGVCEACGREGMLINDNCWYKTLCPECDAKRRDGKPY